VISDALSALEGDTFVVSNQVGNLEGSHVNTQGLFHQDTRYLSRWVLTVNNILPAVLSVGNPSHFAQQFFLAPSLESVYVNSKLSLIRTRVVGLGFHEDLTLFNYSSKTEEVEIKIEVAADFADLLEVKDKLTKKGNFYHRIDDGTLVLGYQREHFIRETCISPSQSCIISPTTLTFRLQIQPQSRWTTCLQVAVSRDIWGVSSAKPKHGHDDIEELTKGQQFAAWKAEAPVLICSLRSLERTYERSLIDLAALRFTPPMTVGGPIPAAGLPWFMALFGRDSIITSYQALPFDSRLAKATLISLAGWQGTEENHFREEEPGKIPHEIRWGELTAFKERPYSPYYGSHDSTPLFLILLDEYERWTGDRELVRSLEIQARAALSWIDNYGDSDGDGYLEYERKNQEMGLENQCWKDSWDSIVFSNGTLASTPRACCEIQGYVYDAKVRTARLARDFWGDPLLADELEDQARALKERFNRDFWIKSRGYFALALDGKKKQVDALTSNIGHLLWSGIVNEDKAPLCVHHLMSEKLFSGWGFRTLSLGSSSYNPIGYHVGTVWPHDTAFVILGLRRYGFRQESANASLAMIEAAEHFKGRLPEAFAGYARELTHVPVEYPTASSPQAWATGAPLLIIRALLGLEPMGEHLIIDPAIPTAISRLELLGIPGRWHRMDAFGRGLIGILPVQKAA